MACEKRILFAAKLQEGTGNCSTAHRLQSILERLGHSVTAVESNEPLCFSDYDIVIVLHALHFSNLLLSCKSLIPTIVVVGGTDINCGLSEDSTRHIIIDILNRSTKIVAFNTALEGLILSSIYDLEHHKVTIIPQSLDITRDILLSKGEKLRERLGYKTTDFVCMLPAGLREVKAPHYIFDLFSELHAHDESIHLLLIGPILDAVYLNQHGAYCHCISNPDVAFHDMAAIAHNIKSRNIMPTPRTGVMYHPPIPRGEFLSLMVEMDVVLNTSDSEGMCGAIMEAMALRVPVVARSQCYYFEAEK